MYLVSPALAFRGQDRVLDPYKWAFRWVWGPMWVLSIKLKSPGRTASALSPSWMFKVPATLKLLWQAYSDYSWHASLTHGSVEFQDCCFPVVLLLFVCFSFPRLFSVRPNWNVTTKIAWAPWWCTQDSALSKVWKFRLKDKIQSHFRFPNQGTTWMLANENITWLSQFNIYNSDFTNLSLARYVYAVFRWYVLTF